MSLYSMALNGASLSEVLKDKGGNSKDGGGASLEGDN